MQCTAKAKSTGEQCRRAAMANGKCQVHGGPTPRGLANPNTKTGRYSKDLPTRMLADYQAEVNDPDLLNISDSIALVRARKMELLRRVDSGETGRIWRDLKATYKAMKDAQRAKDMAEVARLLTDLGGLITHGNADIVAWTEIFSLVEQERKLTETEQKRRVAMQTMVTAERGRLLIMALMDSVNRHVDDKRTTAAIGADIMALIGDGAG